MNSETLLNTGLRNLWYPVVPSWRLHDAPLGITRLGENIVLWRDPHGAIRAIEDRCHRNQRSYLSSAGRRGQHAGRVLHPV